MSTQATSEAGSTMPRRYQSFTENTVRSLLETAMGFHQVLSFTEELVWERVVGNSGYAIRVYSSVFNGVTKKAGTTTIRVCLIDVITQQMILLPFRVYRSPSALSIMRQRVGELWRWAEAHKPAKGGFSNANAINHERTFRNSIPGH